MHVAPTTVERAKKLAKILKSNLQKNELGIGDTRQPIDIPFSHCLEVISRGSGMVSWHDLSARLKKRPDLSWNDEAAGNRLREYLPSLTVAESRATIGQLGVHMRARVGKMSTDADCLFDTECGKHNNLEGWAGKTSSLLSHKGFSGIVASLVTKVQDDRALFVKTNLQVLDSSPREIPEYVKKGMASVLWTLANRPLHPAWPVIALFMIYFFAMNSSNKEKLMKENVWDHVMLAFIPIVHAFESRDPVHLSNGLWGLDDQMRATLIDMSYDRVLSMVGNLVGFGDGTIYPDFDEMQDLDNWLGPDQTDHRPGTPSGGGNESPFSPRTTRWNSFGKGDLELFVWFDEYVPEQVWARCVDDNEHALSLFKQFSASAPITELGSHESTACTAFFIGKGADPDAIFATAGMILDWLWNEDAGLLSISVRYADFENRDKISLHRKVLVATSLHEVSQVINMFRNDLKKIAEESGDDPLEETVFVQVSTNETAYLELATELASGIDAIAENADIDDDPVGIERLGRTRR